mmetsp:Transcript_35079/g.100743  ORF Transcript_35079/g.100743 Transcript_35079/m.100743 type:complete len:1846 (+) Transcript_35079:263-5800(+)
MNSKGRTRGQAPGSVGRMAPDHADIPAPAAAAGKPSASPAPAAARARPAGGEDKVKETTARVAAVEAESLQVLENAREMLEAEDSTEETVAEAEGLLKAQQAVVQQAQKSLAQDINEARMSGAAPAKTSEISKLLPKLRSLQMNLNTEINRAKGQLGKVQSRAEDDKRRAEADERQQVAERRDAKALQDALPQAVELVTQAEDAVETVAILAAPFNADEELGESDKKTMDDIEEQASKASAALVEARKAINQRLAEAKKYAPEARRVALSELQALQGKVTEAGKRLNPLKKFRQEFEQRAAAKKAVDEIAARLSNAELEVEKAYIMTASAGDGQMSEDEIKSTDELLGPAGAGITEATQMAERRARTAGESFQKDLAAVQDRAKVASSKLEEVRIALRKQREGLSAQRVLAQAHEKIEKAEEALTATAEAEMPFLKGVEALSQTEAMHAVKDSETAAAKTETAVDLAKTFIKAKLAEAKLRYSKGVGKRIVDELSELQTRAEGLQKRLRDFKKETSSRKTSSLLQEVVEAVAEAETQVQTLSEVAKLFTSENLNEVSTESLKSTCEQTVVAEKDASTACMDARKVLSSKQKDAKDASLISELSKLQHRLNTTQHELTKLKKTASTGERLIKAKQVLLEEEEKIKSAELEVAKVETLATPVGDSKPTDATIQKIDAAVDAAQGALTSVMHSIDAHIPNAMPALKASLSKLLARAKKSQDKVDNVKNLTRSQRERVSSETYMKQAIKKTEEVETSLEKVSEAELPFLKGIEVLPLREAKATLQNSEAAADAVQKALSEARTFIASKTLEVRRFSEELAKPSIEEFQKLTERVNACYSKLQQFRRDTESRRRTSLMQEATEKLTSVEAEVEKTTEAAAPLATEDLDALSAEAATEICEKLAALERAAQAKMDDARAFLTERQKDVKGHPNHEEQLKKLQSKLSAIQVELTKSKKAASEREQKFVAKKLLAEAGDMLGEVEAEIEKATETSSPLVSDGGQGFLVANNVLLLVEAFREHVQKPGVTKESLFKQLTGGATSVKQPAFAASLEKLPEVLSREDLAFSDEQREAIFKHIDADKNGVVTFKEFEDIFTEKFMCIHGISVTDAFEISNSKTVSKLELDEVVVAIAPPKTNENLGVTRLQCRVVESGQEGWVTMKGNQGTVYLEPFSPYTSFAKALDRVIEATAKKTAKASTFIKQKASELASCSQGPLMEARGELSKLRPKVSGSQKKIEELKKRVADAKKEYSKKEEAERRVQQEVRDKKTAASILGAVNERVDAMEATAKKLEEAVQSLTSIEGPALEAFATPVSVTQESEKLAAALIASVAAVKACLTSHQGTVARAPRGPLHEAKQAVAKVMVKVDATEKKSVALQVGVKAACNKICTAAAAKAAAAFREEVQRRDISMDELFLQIAKPSTEQISEEAFCKKLKELPDLGLSAEQALLLTRHIEAGGVGRRSFLRLLQQYYACVKQIAVTSDFEISKSKTKRMLEVDEVVEILEGPRGDDKLGVTRVRGKALSDGVCGWISVKGNQGTPFLKETAKPFLVCLSEVTLEPNFRSGAAPAVRQLRPEEVLEVLEGPLKDKVGDALRVRARCCKDGALGWLTAKDREGVAHAEASGKYYSCTSAIAMTDVQDIKQCKVMRKMEVTEVLKVLEGPCTEEGTGVFRIRGKSMKDGLEGWVTIKGNAGTVYAEESTKLYTVLQETPLQKRFSSEGAEVMRMLAKDEAVEILEGPKEERFEAVVRAKGKALSDGAVGWVTLREKALRPWSPGYKVATATVIQDSLQVKGAQTLRKLEVGESVEVLEGPMLEKDLDVLRIKGRAEKDGSVGWITIKGNQGTAFLAAKQR